MAKMYKNTSTEEEIFIPVSPGELLDKIVILEIKIEEISDSQKTKHIEYELSLLQDIAKEHIQFSQDIKKLAEQLKAVNERLWEHEENIRTLDRKGFFGKRFTNVARNIYQDNDLRAKIKREINLVLESRIIEEKSYES